MSGAEGICAPVGHWLDRDVERLERGELVTEVCENPPGLGVHAVIASAPVRVFEFFADYRRLPERIFGLEAVQVLNQRKHEATVRFTMKLPFPVGQITWTNLIRTRQRDGFYALNWTLVDGDLRTNDGELLMTPHLGQNNRTYAQYRVSVESRSRLPRSAQRLATRWLLPRVVDRLRRAIEKP